MYRILIVDDEKIERNGIKMLLKMVMKAEYETREAADGREALEILNQGNTDILLTDVRMPFMDGLELISRAQETSRDICCVIFSGCSEFDYARQAVRLGVADYILKPVDPAEFASTLKNVVDRLDKVRRNRELQVMNSGYIKEHALYMLVNGSEASEVLQKINDPAVINDLNGIRRMMLIEFNSDFFGTEGIDFEEKVLKRSGINGTYLNLNPVQSVLFFNEDRGEFDKDAASLAELVKEEYGKSCHISISSSVNEASEIPSAMDKLEELMENKFYHPSQDVFFEGMDNSMGDIIEIEDDTLMKQMKQDLKMKDLNALQEHFSRFSMKYRKKTAFSQMYIKFLFANLIKDIYDCLPEKNEKTLNKAIDALYRTVDFTSMTRLVEENITKLEGVFNSGSSGRKDIEIVQQYIYRHFSEEISIEQLGELVYMTPSYLSFIFKKETGQNLSRFIKACRMDKAREMLENTVLKIVDISSACGYSNVSYFCSSFRDYFGVSPQKFRENREET